MVASTHQLKKYLNTQWLEPNLSIRIQVPFKPGLTSYETKLKSLLLPMSSMSCYRYSKNYNLKMFIKEVGIINKIYFFDQIMDDTQI